MSKINVDQVKRKKVNKINRNVSELRNIFVYLSEFKQTVKCFGVSVIN